MRAAPIPHSQMEIRMPRHAALPLALLAALALSACAIDEVGDAVTDTREVVGDEEPAIPDEEFAEVRTNCRLPGALLTRQGRGWRLSLPAETYAARESQPTASHIACVTQWARERRMTLAIVEAR